jgi:hypothetical protein
MPVRNQNWYNLQEGRRYPLDDNSSGTDDDGNRIRDSIIVDLNIRFPNTVAKYAFVGGITVTANLVTVTILGADSLTTTSDFIPLAAATFAKPIDEYVHQALTPLVAGVGGWIVFGGGIVEDAVLRFSTPAQSLLAPKTSRSYEPLPVETIGKQFVEPALTGLVNIEGTGEIEVVKDTVEIEGKEVDAVVVRLVQDFFGTNPLEAFIGPCGGRPESNTCTRDGVESVNGVVPDCDGNLTITFRGVVSALFENCGGQEIDMGLALQEACGFATTFVNYDDLCEEVLSSQASFESQISSSLPSIQPPPSMSSAAGPCVDLPYLQNFDGPDDDEDWQVQTGTWVLEPGVDSPEESLGSFIPGSISSSSSISAVPIDQTYTASSGGINNIVLVQDCTGYTLDRRVTTDLQMLGTHVDRNAGIILNYHAVTGPPIHIEYFFVRVNHVTLRLEVLRWTGFVFVTEFSTPLAATTVLGDWYRLSVKVTPFFEDNIAMEVSIRGISDAAWSGVSFSIVVDDYLPADGIFGLGTVQAHSRFSFFELKEES